MSEQPPEPVSVVETPADPYAGPLAFEAPQMEWIKKSADESDIVTRGTSHAD